jgi:hypothetical protein
MGTLVAPPTLAYEQPPEPRRPPGLRVAANHRLGPVLKQTSDRVTLAESRSESEAVRAGALDLVQPGREDRGSAPRVDATLTDLIRV